MVRIEREKSGKIIRTIVSDMLTREDYDKILSALQQTVKEWSRIRWYFEMRNFGGWEPGAAFQELKFDVEHADEVAKIALTGTEKWKKWLTNGVEPFGSAEVRFFNISEREEAIRWIESLNTKEE